MIIRTNNCSHILIVDTVTRTNGVVTQIGYAHSNDDEGLHRAYINITDENLDIDRSSTTWVDYANGYEYLKANYNSTVFLDCVAQRLKRFAINSSVQIIIFASTLHECTAFPFLNLS